MTLMSAGEPADSACDLIICSRDQARIDSAAETIRRDTGGRVRAMRADVSSPGEAARLVELAVTEYGGLEIVVHNAGGPPPGPTVSMTDDQWRQAFEQTLLSLAPIGRRFRK